MADHHADHQHGSMSIKDHEKTFVGFIRMATYVAIIAICILIFMALVNS
jgi:Bacterial aa3 type cytochrome c oxidase subunit IV